MKKITIILIIQILLISTAIADTNKAAIIAIVNQLLLTSEPDSPSDSIGRQKILFALINFQDNKERIKSIKDVKDLILNNPDSLNKFIITNSNKKTWLEADFVDWLTLNKQSSYYFNGSELKNNEFHDDALTALNQVKTLASYDRVVLLVKDGFQGHPGCYAYQSKVTFGNNNEYNGYFVVLGGYDMGCLRPGRIAHELGHTFGFGHSLASLDCNETVPISLVDRENSCAFSRMTSWTFDTMGSDSYFPLYSSVWRAQAGWFNKNQILSVTRSGVYFLEQSELISSGVKLIKIPLGVGENGKQLNYYIEFRKKFNGFDAALFNVTNNQYEVIVRTDELLTSINNLLDFGVDVLDVNKDFIDVYRDIKISVVSFEGDAESSLVKLNINVPRILIEPANLITFNDSTNLEKNITIKNISSENLIISQVSISGRNSAAFNIMADNCINTTILPAQSCKVRVRRISELAVLAHLKVSINDKNISKIVELTGVNIYIEPPYDPDAILEWQDLSSSGEDLNFNDAISYCQNLTIQSNSDWRLPRIEELRQTFQLSNPPLFTIDRYLWSSTEVANNGLNAYQIYGNGSWAWQNVSKTNSLGDALCVRSVE